MSRRYLIRRLLQVPPAVAGIVLLTFLLIHLAPGDPVDALASDGGDEAYLARVRAEYGLDRPLPQQFLAYAGNVLKGDLGDSFAQARPVKAIIGARIQPTLLLTGSAIVVSTLGALALAVRAVRRPFGPFDVTIGTTALVAYAMPAFWLAQIVILTVALKTGWFPVQGYTDARSQFTGTARAVDIAHHLILPMLVLATSEVALLERVARTGLLRELGKDYVRTARAKGLDEHDVLSRHALRNGLLPVISIVGTRVGFLFSGAVLVETVFAWPGLGTLLVESARAQDHPVVLALVLLVALSVVVGNLVTDLISAAVDTRLRYR